MCSSVTQVQLCFEIFETILKNYIELWKFFSLQQQPRNPQTTYIFCTNWIRGCLQPEFETVWNCFGIFFLFYHDKYSPQLSSLCLHSFKVILWKGKAAALCQLHVSYVRVTPERRSYVRNISSTGPGEFSLPSQRCFTRQGRRVQKRQRGILQTVISLSSFVCFKKQVLIVEKPDRWCWQLAHRQRERERQKEIKEGRRQINCQTDWMPGLRVSEIKTGCCSLDMMDFSPSLLSLAKLLQLHARLCRPSGKKGDCFCRGTTVPASYTDWSEGFGKPISPCFKHNKQNGWMYAIVLYLGGGRAEGRGAQCLVSELEW